MLANSPGGNLGFESAPFKLTPSFVELMGGTRSRCFRDFRGLCVETYLALRRNSQVGCDSDCGDSCSCGCGSVDYFVIIQENHVRSFIYSNVHRTDRWGMSDMFTSRLTSHAPSSHPVCFLANCVHLIATLCDAGNCVARADDGKWQRIAAVLSSTRWSSSSCCRSLVPFPT